ncbi:MAG: class I mannose-6-phosphate isomerase [Saprospiraceae bacterium]|nr:class I mannose-6-phosphate isomerase [Saprospiraceae bacterium]
MIIYPIKFTPILKEKIWGGNKLNKILGKVSDKSGVGESWEISDVEENISVVSNGSYQGQDLKELIKNHKAAILGSNNFKNFGCNFPLLIKFLDARTDLSVQVHPDNDMAKRYHDSFGKTEMWYIMDSDTNADIVLGLKNKNINPDILDDINADNVKTVFNRETVKNGDSFFIPAGKIHAIGAGVLAAEIQQTSDITYRVYDWDRKDDKGNKRDLHLDLAKKSIKPFYSNERASYKLRSNEKANLVKCDYFTTNILDISENQVVDYSALDSFVIFMCVEGELNITLNNGSEILKKGETALIPALTNKVHLDSVNAKVLEIYID